MATPSIGLGWTQLNNQTTNLRQMTSRIHKTLLLIPIWGTLVFVVLYVIAAFLYPGGSQVDNNSIGFSWAHNYWCNLLNERAINGQHNPAKPVALTAMSILCLTFTSFWVVFPKHLTLHRKLSLLIQISGTLAVAIGFFLFTNINHDLITNLASFFGAIATIGILVGLYQNRWLGLFTFGLLNVLLVGLNNWCYYNNDWIVFLPVVQKITFAAFLIWIGSITTFLYRGQRKTASNTSFGNRVT